MRIRVVTFCSYTASLFLFLLALRQMHREEKEERKQKAETEKQGHKDRERLLQAREVRPGVNSAQPSDSGPSQDLYLSLLAGTDWTLQDIRAGRRLAGSQLAGVGGEIRLPFPETDPVQPSAVNRTTGSQTLVYNRVPKCASETMLGLVKKLAVRNGFQYRNSPVYWRQVLSPGEESSLVASLQGHQGRLLFDRHFYILDHSQHPGLQLDWVNMVREPVSRMVSQFHYLRSEKRWRRRTEKPPREWREKDFDTCVQSNDPECLVGVGGQDMQLSYFCGSQSECSNAKSGRALQMAKYNIEHRYSVVGVMEELATSLVVLEARLPHWFQGAPGLRTEHRNQHSHPPASPTSLAILKDRLSNDLELYRFALQRLHLQNITLAAWSGKLGH